MWKLLGSDVIAKVLGVQHQANVCVVASAADKFPSKQEVYDLLGAPYTQIYFTTQFKPVFSIDLWQLDEQGLAGDKAEQIEALNPDFSIVDSMRLLGLKQSFPSLKISDRLQKKLLADMAFLVQSDIQEITLEIENTIFPHNWTSLVKAVESRAL